MMEFGKVGRLLVASRRLAEVVIALADEAGVEVTKRRRRRRVVEAPPVAKKARKGMKTPMGKTVEEE